VINLGNQLQEILDGFACTELNYTNNKIYAWHFYSEERYADFLKGSKCWAGQGLFDADEIVEFNKLKDNVLVIIKHDGVETARYKYEPIFKGTMEYKYMDDYKKNMNRTLTFTIRKGTYDGKINFIDTDRNSLDFYNIEAVKRYLNGKYGVYKLTDWSVFIG
jgi:hypothetical protein